MSKARTQRHINQVEKLMWWFANQIMIRAHNHDASKLEEPEASIFEKYSDKISQFEFGSEEYFDILVKMKEATDHHYSNNRHHPEHFKPKVAQLNTFDEISCMNLIDIVEMFIDWKAASMVNNGDIDKSIQIGKGRFGINYQLIEIFKNTAKEIKEQLNI